MDLDKRDEREDAKALEHIREATSKLTQIIVQSRVSFDPKQTSGKLNSWFNLQTTDIDEVASKAATWRSHPRVPLHILVYVAETEDDPDKKTLLEHWKIHLSTPDLKDSESSGFTSVGPPANNRLRDLATVNKRLMILVRAVYSYVRMMPGYRVFRERIRNKVGGYITEFKFEMTPSAEIDDELNTTPSIEYNFGDIETKVGTFSTWVKYRVRYALKARPALAGLQMVEDYAGKPGVASPTGRSAAMAIPTATTQQQPPPGVAQSAPVAMTRRNTISTPTQAVAAYPAAQPFGSPPPVAAPFSTSMQYNQGPYAAYAQQQQPQPAPAAAVPSQQAAPSATGGRQTPQRQRSVTVGDPYAPVGIVPQTAPAIPGGSPPLTSAARVMGASPPYAQPQYIPGSSPTSQSPTYNNVYGTSLDSAHMMGYRPSAMVGASPQDNVPLGSTSASPSPDHVFRSAFSRNRGQSVSAGGGKRVGSSERPSPFRDFASPPNNAPIAFATSPPTHTGITFGASPPQSAAPTPGMISFGQSPPAPASNYILQQQQRQHSPLQGSPKSPPENGVFHVGQDAPTPGSIPVSFGVSPPGMGSRVTSSSSLKSSTSNPNLRSAMIRDDSDNAIFKTDEDTPLNMGPSPHSSMLASSALQKMGSRSGSAATPPTAGTPGSTPSVTAHLLSMSRTSNPVEEDLLRQLQAVPRSTDAITTMGPLLAEWDQVLNVTQQLLPPK